MQPAGWLTMIVSIGAVLALLVFCLREVLSLPPVDEESIEGPLTIDTGDTDNAD